MNLFHAPGNGDLPEAGAFAEGVLADLRQAFRQRDIGQGFAEGKRVIADDRYAFRSDEQLPNAP